MHNVFAQRLQLVLPDLIHTDQVAGIKGRYIGCNIRNVIDIFEYTENNDIPGALLCIDFKKAFDTVERNFLYSVLERLNFGQNFIKWMQTLYNEPMFKIKNNGWISKAYPLERSLRQGCPMSASLFVIIIEVLGIMIRKAKNINGIEINQIEHKIIQYADDATICVRNLPSIRNAVNIINEFSSYAGPQLNLKKTKGIWLGPLKDLGLRIFENLKWTGKPMKLLGIYIGHKRETCEVYNWIKRLDKAKQMITYWKRRKLSLFGRVYVIKTYILSKFVYPASVLTVPENIIKEIKNIIFDYLWDGKRDKIKRSSIINNLANGGINMIDLDSYFLSLKAVWASRIISCSGKWSSLFYQTLSEHNLPPHYIWKTSFKNANIFPLVDKFSSFYKEVIIAFNSSKYVKPFQFLNKLLEQPLWGNEYFKVK